MLETTGRGVRKVLTIAGSDCGGGAGIQADLKTFAALGVYGTCAITAVTAQNTLGVQGIFGLSPDFVVRQIESVLSDIGTDAIKTGMLYRPGLIEVVASALESLEVPLVVDPVMVATSGDRLLTPEGESALRERLLPLADFVTPNVAEASVLWGRSIESSNDVYAAAQGIKELGPGFVIITGIRKGDLSVDLCYDGKEFWEMEGPFLETPNTHGTGCTFSAALAAFLARGFTGRQAAALAKEYVTAGLRYSYRVGSGRGPLNHVASFFPGLLEDPVVLETRFNSFRGWGIRTDLGPFPALYVILGGPFCQERSHAELALAAIRGGARIVQLREKEGDSRKLVEIATGVCEVCRAHGAFFIVNDRVDIAIASGADGVHLGDEDLPPQLARAVLGPEKIIGVSVANLDQAKAAEAAGADYLGLGPVYPTSTKECKVLPCGPQVVAEVVSAVSIPVFAIGGITPENALPVLEAGAAGVAVISAVFGKPEPERACREFLEVFSRVEKGGRRT